MVLWLFVYVFLPPCPDVFYNEIMIRSLREFMGSVQSPKNCIVSFFLEKKKKEKKEEIGF